MKATKYVLAMALGIVALVAAPAYADNSANFTLNFTTTTGGPPDASGSFTYDPTTQLLSNFQVTWDGFNFDLTSAANAPQVFGGLVGCVGGLTPGAQGFALMTQTLTGCTITRYEWDAEAFSDGEAQFGFQVVGATFFADGATFSTLLSAPPSSSCSPLLNCPSATAEGTWSVTQTPEPSSVLLLGTGLLS